MRYPELDKYPKLSVRLRLPYMPDDQVLRLLAWYKHCAARTDNPRSTFPRLHYACYGEALKRGLIE